jgi:hypothetical protein
MRLGVAEQEFGGPRDVAAGREQCLARGARLEPHLDEVADVSLGPV